MSDKKILVRDAIALLDRIEGKCKEIICPSDNFHLAKLLPVTDGVLAADALKRIGLPGRAQEVIDAVQLLCNLTWKRVPSSAEDSRVLLIVASAQRLIDLLAELRRVLQPEVNANKRNRDGFRLKVARAMERLQTGPATSSELMLEVGLTSAPHFRRRFGPALKALGVKSSTTHGYSL